MAETPWKTYLKSFLPGVSLLAVFVLVVASLYLAGVIVTPKDCGACATKYGDVSSCALFLSDPKTTKNPTTLAWTISAIIFASMVIILRLPGLWEALNEPGKARTVLRWVSLSIFVISFFIVFVCGAVQAARFASSGEDPEAGARTAGDDDERSDNGAGALLLGGIGFVVLVLCIMASSGPMGGFGCAMLFQAMVS